MNDHRSDIAQTIADKAGKHFENFLFVGWQRDDKWIMTVKDRLSTEHLTALRDYLNRLLEAN